MTYYHLDRARQELDTALPDVEIFWRPKADPCYPAGPGFYYWFCSPGYMPDSDCDGPYSNEDEALAAARQGQGFCAHGLAEDAVCEECPAPVLWALVTADPCPRQRYVTFGAGGAPIREGSPLCYSADVRYAACWATEKAAIDTASDGFRRGWCRERLKAVRLGDSDARAWGI